LGGNWKMSCVLYNLPPLSSVGIKEESPLKGQKPTAGSQSFPTCTPAIKTFMPALSPTMEEENIVRQLKNEGDTVDVGDALGEIETDKAVVTMDESVQLGALTGLLVEEGQNWKQVEIPNVIGEAPSLSGPLATTPVPIPSPSAASLHEAEQHPEKLQFCLSPAACNILESHGLNASSCLPSDPRASVSQSIFLSCILSQHDIVV
uniref:Lipoyl-binding domain-containing protein n=1 Tax=Anolis carolinensis TaxID=28377 RepID=A0A803TVA6_ANOCA